MFSKKISKKSAEGSSKMDVLPEIALAAIISSKKQKDVSDFITLLLAALERNCEWLNVIVGKQSNFRCALMVGAGPNRYQIQEIIYPSNDKDIKFEVELRDSDDHDKVAIAALIRLSNAELSQLLDYIKTRLNDNATLKEDLVKGKAMGLSYAILRPFSDKQYRIADRIIISPHTVPSSSTEKRKRDEKPVAKTSLVKRAKKVV